MIAPASLFWDKNKIDQQPDQASKHNYRQAQTAQNAVYHS